MKSKTIKELVDQGITITLNGGMYEGLKSGESVTIFKTFDDALDFASKKIVIGDAMVGFNESMGITLDDAIRHLEIMDKEYDLDSYTEEVMNMLIKHLKGDSADKPHPRPQLCYGDCGNVYEDRHLNYIDNPHSDEVLLFCNQCAFQFLARLHENEEEMN